MNPPADLNRYGSGLFEQHQAQLAAWGISIDVAHERGYVSADRKAQLERAGFGKSQRLVPGLLIPLHDVRGELAAW